MCDKTKKVLFGICVKSGLLLLNFLQREGVSGSDLRAFRQQTRRRRGQRCGGMKCQTGCRTTVVSSQPHSSVFNNRHPSATLSPLQSSHTPATQEAEMSLLPIRNMGLVVPVLPTLQGVDVCVHTGLAPGHRTRHGGTRGSDGLPRCGCLDRLWGGFEERWGSCVWEESGTHQPAGLQRKEGRKKKTW